jgi:hypothetical protein
MALSDRIYERTDKPMTWTKAILVGIVIWAFAIVALGQAPSYIIYWSDQNVDAIIEFTKSIPGVNEEGLNTKQVAIVRDIVANTVQIGFFLALLAGAYIWQERKRKRVGGRGPQDVVKGYMPGK